MVRRHGRQPTAARSVISPLGLEGNAFAGIGNTVANVAVAPGARMICMGGTNSGTVTAEAVG